MSKLCKNVQCFMFCYPPQSTLNLILTKTNPVIKLPYCVKRY